MTGVKRRLNSDSDIHALHKQLDEVSCPICLDHPHNAVLILCSSHDKGCRSYICDTSYRHSNCLDRFKKARVNSSINSTFPSSAYLNTRNSSDTSDANLIVQDNLNEGSEIHLNEISTELSVGLPQGARQGNNQGFNRPLDSFNEGVLGVLDTVTETLQERVEVEELNVDRFSESKFTLRCPLCRGTVLGWEVVEDARNYLNMKKRNCSRDSCSFSGNYNELRRHARRIHPTTHPSDVDPSRERAWRHLERQREHGDVVSAVRSAMPGAVVVGDYVIENDEGRFPVGDRESGIGDAGAPWWSTLLFQMIGSVESIGEPRFRSSRWTRHHHATGGAAGSSSGRRRFLWGENLLGLHEDDTDEDDNDLLYVLQDVDEEASTVPRRRRRWTRSSSNET